VGNVFRIVDTGNVYARYKTIDISNSEKHVLDIIMLPKFYEEFANLNMDDKHVLEMNSKKILSENGEYYINVIIEVVSLESVFL